MQYGATCSSSISPTSVYISPDRLILFGASRRVWKEIYVKTIVLLVASGAAYHWEVQEAELEAAVITALFFRKMRWNIPSAANAKWVGNYKLSLLCEQPDVVADVARRMNAKRSNICFVYLAKRNNIKQHTKQQQLAYKTKANQSWLLLEPQIVSHICGRLRRALNIVPRSGLDLGD